MEFPSNHNATSDNSPETRGSLKSALKWASAATVLTGILAYDQSSKGPITSGLMHARGRYIDTFKNPETLGREWRYILASRGMEIVHRCAFLSPKQKDAFAKQYAIAEDTDVVAIALLADLTSVAPGSGPEKSAFAILYQAARSFEHVGDRENQIRLSEAVRQCEVALEVTEPFCAY